MPLSLQIQLETRDLSRELAQRKRDHIPRFRDRLIEQLAVQLLEQIQQRTPVETGQARDGWELQQGVGNKDETTHTITNHVPYIVFLEEGTRGTRPHHMVKRSLANSSAIVRELASPVFRETMGAAP